jgi:hypothetical protein
VDLAYATTDPLWAVPGADGSAVTALSAVWLTEGRAWH